ncbi:peptidase inhibitor family I36 protein [Streptomyces bauhiniae]|uniref:peptidase inhibitor family I36 protein n=1 Tax=Streptomyces bauhiniae TaxID=2340725 RepID=UPI00380B404D
MFTRRHVAVVAAAWSLALGGIGSAQAYADDAPETVQQQINDVLATTQGGEQISSNEIAWQDGNVIMSFPDPGEWSAPASSPEAATLAATASAPEGTSSAAIAKAADAIVADAATDDGADEGGTDDPPSGVVAAGSDSSCPTVTFGNDYYCFYQYSNYGGRRLQFSGAYTMTQAVMFDAYDFENRTSSWSNKGAKTIYVGGRTVTGNNYSCHNYVNDKRPVLWEEPEHSHSKSLGSLDNKADCFWAQ